VRGSDLVRAEAAEWTGDTLLSLGVLVGFTVALVLDRTGRADLARYVDPAMVALISAAFLPVPLRLATRGVREILTMAPAQQLRDQLAEHVEHVEHEYGFAESYLRASKVGSRLDVEIDFVVPDTARAQCVRDFDEVRADLYGRLQRLAPVTAMTVSFTADPKWAR
jgi:predicted Co/Zn/Cd cation transporter (cation efflux family)